MKKLTNLILSLFATILVSCQIGARLATISAEIPGSGTVTPSLETTMTTSAIEITPLITQPASTSASFPTITTPTKTAKPTPTPTIPPEARLQFQCIHVDSELQKEMESNGFVILQSHVSVGNGSENSDTFVLDIATKQTVKTSHQDEMQLDHRVSPDRKFRAYKSVLHDAEGKTVKEELVIAAADGQRVKVRPWEESWSRITDWLDTKRLVIEMKPEENATDKAATLLVLNPFSGTWQVLRPYFPRMYYYFPIPDWDFWGITVYDPSLTRVVYLRINQKGEYEYALWDIKKQQLLATLDYDSQTPRWSPDGSYVLVDGLIQGQPLNIGGLNDYQTYLVSQDGQVAQLTHLDIYEHSYLLSYSWSPDGSSVAAWFGSPALRETHEVELAILDMDTRQVTDTCVQVKFGGDKYGDLFPKAPIWSPDGKQLVVMDWYEADHRRVILVDPGQSYAAQIAQDMEPVGWMLAP